MTFQKKIFFSAVVLAAGHSKRFGKQKLLLPIGKTTVIENIVDSICRSKVDQVVVVTGYKADYLKMLLKGRKIKLIFNKDHVTGMSSSIVCGVKSISGKNNAIVFFLADQPLVSTELINRLLSSYAVSNKGILYPVYNNIKGHPVIFSIKYKNDLMKLRGDKGAREIIKNNPTDIAKIMVDTDEILKDIDTPEDYHSLFND